MMITRKLGGGATLYIWCRRFYVWQSWLSAVGLVGALLDFVVQSFLGDVLFARLLWG